MQDSLITLIMEYSYIVVPDLHTYKEKHQAAQTFSRVDILTLGSAEPSGY